MEIVRNIALVLHLAGMAGVLISLLASRGKLSSGITHSALLALISGLALVGIRYGLHDADPVKWEAVDHAKVAIKLTFVLIVLALGYRYKKKEDVSSFVVPLIAGLTIANIAIAYAW